MIVGIGCDIIEIDRIRSAVEKNGFTEKLFTERERDYFLKKGIALQTIAGSFASKEAVSKALGTGISGFSMRDIEILREENGKPYALLSGGAKKLLDELDGEVFITISHSEKYAVAYAVIEKGQ